MSKAQLLLEEVIGAKKLAKLEAVGFSNFLKGSESKNRALSGLDGTLLATMLFDVIPPPKPPYQVQSEEKETSVVGLDYLPLEQIVSVALDPERDIDEVVSENQIDQATSEELVLGLQERFVPEMRLAPAESHILPYIEKHTRKLSVELTGEALKTLLDSVDDIDDIMSGTSKISKLDIPTKLLELYYVVKDNDQTAGNDLTHVYALAALDLVLEDNQDGVDEEEDSDDRFDRIRGEVGGLLEGCRKDRSRYPENTIRLAALGVPKELVDIYLKAASQEDEKNLDEAEIFFQSATKAGRFNTRMRTDRDCMPSSSSGSIYVLPSFDSMFTAPMRAGEKYNPSGRFQYAKNLITELMSAAGLEFDLQERMSQGPRKKYLLARGDGFAIVFQPSTFSFPFAGIGIAGGTMIYMDSSVDVSGYNRSVESYSMAIRNRYSK